MKRGTRIVAAPSRAVGAAETVVSGPGTVRNSLDVGVVAGAGEAGAADAAADGAGALSDPGLAGAASPTRFFFAPVLKSVSYQPLPASRKPGAEMVLLSAGLPQAGHSRAGASDTFCRISVCAPQA